MQGLKRGERLQIMLSPQELEALDDFRFKHRMPSRAAAVREMFRVALASTAVTVATANCESNAFGVRESTTTSEQAREPR